MSEAIMLFVTENWHPIVGISVAVVVALIVGVMVGSTLHK
jgi:hypothetical protein